MVLARRLILALAVLTALGGSVAYFITAMRLRGAYEQATNLGWLVFALMTGLSVLLAVLIWHSLSRSLRSIRDQLCHFAAHDEIGLIMIDEHDDLADLVAGLNHYLTRLKQNLQDHRLRQKELEVQARVAETELRQTQAVILGISEAVLVTNRFDELLLANQAAQHLFGFRLETCYRQPVELALCVPELLALIRAARQNKCQRLVRLLEHRPSPDDKPLSLKVLLSCVLDEQRDVLGVVVVIHDVTAEQELVRLKDDFLSSVSHELKTPLASIQAYAEMLADDEDRDEPGRRQFCEIIQEQGRRLHRLIENILNVSRLESGMVRPHKERLDLSEVARAVADALQPQAREKNLHLQLDQSDQPVTVLADRDMMFQAVSNLLGNAIKYSHPDGRVRLAVAARQDHAVVEVQDEGIGIPAASLDRIFEKFYRVHQTSRLAGGTGVGLHLVRQIVENFHQGRVRVESQPGRGSTFTLALPLTPGPQPAPA